MRFYLIGILFSLLFISSVEAQRIRYKNLFPILQSKDFTSAEPQLLKFLEDNDDEANAYFYLGEIIVSKLDTVIIFPSTEKYDSMANLAISAYKKSISLVDDREIRKNDNYYAAYNRRDLRTGKFGIKISDIHLDYENKIKEITNKKELIAELHKLKDKSFQEYEQFAKIVNSFYEAYPDESAFVLRANSPDKEDLKEVIDHYNEFINGYTKFSKKLKSLNHPRYNPQLNIIEIESWYGLKLIQSDFKTFIISIQDYEKYLLSLKDKIESEVKPLKDLLYKTDAAFDEAISKNKDAKDSANIQNMIIPEELKNGLSKLDKSNVILNLLEYKKQKSQTGLLANVNLYPVLADSSNIYQRANIVEEYKDKLAAQLELIEMIDENLIDRTVKDFQLFFDGFEPSINAYIDTEKTILKQKLNNVSQKSEVMSRQIEFFTYESDSIYLTPLIAATRESKKYVMNTIELDSMLLVGGLIVENPFVASAGFDMKIKSFKVLDSAFTINNMLLLNNNLLLNLRSLGEDQKSQIVKYLSPDLEEIWKLEYASGSTLGGAKVEAGIYFLYDEEGNVLKTLNSQGEIIGN
ncbi:hypothetical protein [Marivirga sp.]|uniref:hypothetical protein n=1 Tax=Marivirga sp. TaxID=2018662 RepID=UPI0025D59F35|nr:hypothetical protein [Marivirga sp.]